MTPKTLRAMRMNAEKTLRFWMQREQNTGEAIDSMSRAYCEGYADAVVEVMRMGKVKA
jgi:hypothetical protein